MSIDRLLEMPANQYQVVDVIALRDAFHDKVETIVSLREQLSDAQSRVAELEARIDQAQKHGPEFYAVYRDGKLLAHIHAVAGQRFNTDLRYVALYTAPVPPAEAKWADDVVADDVVLVPVDPTEEMWGGLARDIIMWMDLNQRPTVKSLFEHLDMCGQEIPDWLRKEFPDPTLDQVPSKGTRAVIIYRAMLAAKAPAEAKVADDVVMPHSPSQGIRKLIADAVMFETDNEISESGITDLWYDIRNQLKLLAAKANGDGT